MVAKKGPTKIKKMPTVPFFSRNLLLQCLPNITTATPAPFPSQPGGPDPPPPTTSSIGATSSVAFITNYNSLFDISSSASTSNSLPSTFSSATKSSELECSHDADDSPPPDFAAVFASRRFFFSSPGLSKSISTSHHHDKVAANPTPRPPPRPGRPPLDGGVAVKKYSPDPYSDFKKSMEEMIESREIKDARGNWNYLHELLSCYLAMNPKDTHGYIIAAFADTVVRLLSMSAAAAAPLPPPPPPQLPAHRLSDPRPAAVP